MIRLLVTIGKERREVLLRNPDEVSIGRSPGNGLQIRDIRLSRRHARIERDELGFLLKDLGSSNGTWLNRRRIVSNRLVRGDVIRVGSAVIHVLGLEAPRAGSNDPLAAAPSPASS